MKNKLLIRNLIVLVLVAAICVVEARIFLSQREAPALYTGNPNLTGVLKLGDYNENIKGTINDVDIYVFDSGKPGGKALIYGGTHTNEPAGVMNAVTYLENAKCEEGTLYVIIYANNSARTHTLPLFGMSDTMRFELPDGSSRAFSIGSRLTNPVHQWPDHNYRSNTSGRELKWTETTEARNLNRNFPGVKDGNLTEATCYAIYNFVQTEGIDLLVDGHEANAGSSNLVNTLVAHERAMAVGSAAVINSVLNGLPVRVEPSGMTSYGLSHRSLGDNTDALCTLFESCNPSMSPYREKMDDALFKEGKSANYVTLHAAGIYPARLTFDEDGWPIEKRTAYHMDVSRELLDCYSQLNPDRPIRVSGLPTSEEMIEKGLEYTLKPIG